MKMWIVGKIYVVFAFITQEMKNFMSLTPDQQRLLVYTAVRGQRRLQLQLFGHADSEREVQRLSTPATSAKIAFIHGTNSVPNPVISDHFTLKITLERAMALFKFFHPLTTKDSVRKAAGAPEAYSDFLSTTDDIIVRNADDAQRFRTDFVRKPSNATSVKLWTQLECFDFVEPKFGHVMQGLAACYISLAENFDRLDILDFNAAQALKINSTSCHWLVLLLWLSSMTTGIATSSRLLDDLSSGSYSFSLSNSNACLGNISSSEYSALEDLYYSTDGAHWRWHNKLNQSTLQWVFPSSLSAPCEDQWQGITCGMASVSHGSSDTCCITALELPQTNLRGRLPYSLGSLSRLEILRMQYNFLTGTIPSELGDLGSLAVLDLYNNCFTGAIPSEVGDLGSLKLMYLYSNCLTGTIPSELGGLGSLTVLGLNTNCLTGTIPSEMVELGSLTQLYLYSNCLTGTIPSALAELGSLTVLGLNSNCLTGTIPSELAELGSLTGLYLYNNCLAGTIPSGLGNLGSLTLLYLNSNCLTGTIPSELGGLGSLTQLNLYSNCLTGTIPSELAEQGSLTVLGFNTNCLTGTIPSELAELGSLTVLASYSNFLTGTIPSELGGMGSLTVLGMSSNCLTGTIPSELADLSSLTQLYLNTNFLTGTIPSELGNLSSLTQLYLNSNCLAGTIPSELGGLGSLTQLYLNVNCLTGTISPELSSLDSLQELNLGANNLRGNIPSGFGGLVQCYLFNLSNNALTGTIPSFLRSLGSQVVFVNNSNTNVTIVYDNKTVILDSSQNGFTGTIPPALFSKNMQTVSLYSNCLHGSLPAEICAATQLQTLVLDKLTSGQRCVLNIPGFKANFPRQFLGGSIPTCVWSLPQLQTLHVSGNGLQGTLGEISLASNLTVVDASNNFLTGTIPTSIQTHSGLQQLVLAGNKLSGTLLTNFTVANMTNLALAVNRLSGEIPRSFYSSSLQLNVLSGNLFNCTSNDLPANDTSSGSFVCGSDDLDYSLLTWGVCSAATLLLLLLIMLIRFSINSNDVDLAASSCVGSCYCVSETTLAWWRSYSDEVMSTTGLGVFMNAAEGGRATLCVEAIAIVVLCTSAYAWLKSSAPAADTFSDQYTWVTSAAFMHGSVAATTVAVFVAIAVVVAAMIIRQMDSHVSLLDMRGVDTHWVSLKYFTQRVLFQFVSLSVVFTVNVGYVYSVTGTTSSKSHTVIQIAMSLFKLAWKELYINWAINWMQRSHDDLPSSGLLFHDLSMSIFNFVVAPCLATLGTDSRCLYDGVVGEVATPSSFNITFFQTVCIGVTLFGELTETRCIPFPYSQLLAITITPPWLYSYQCTSGLLTNYVPVLLLTYTASGVVIPLVQYGALFVSSEYWARLAALANLLKWDGPTQSTTNRSAAEERDKAVELRDYSTTDSNLSVSTSQGQNHQSRPSKQDQQSARNVLLASDIKPAEKDPSSLTSDIDFIKEEDSSAGRSPLSTATMNPIQGAPVDVITLTQCSAKDSTPAAGDIGGGDGQEVSTRSVEGEEQPAKLFEPVRLKVNLLLDLAVLLTYGLAAPLLALAIIFKQITTSVYLRLLVGKSLSHSGAAGRRRPTASLSQLEEVVVGCGLVDLGTVIFLCLVVFGFWSAMVFDMVADVYGNGTGGVASLVVFLGWAAVACTCGTIAAHMRNRSSNSCCSRNQLQQGNETAKVELGDIYNDLYAGAARGINPQASQL